MLTVNGEHAVSISGCLLLTVCCFSTTRWFLMLVIVVWKNEN